jgi:glucose/arabinose dehydrogenase
LSRFALVGASFSSFVLLALAGLHGCNRDAIQHGPPPPSTGCTPTDAGPATGAKFCDLPGGDAPEIQVPDGFCAHEFTTGPINEARMMRFAPNGDLFLAVPNYPTPGGAANGAGAILVLPDDNHDGKMDGALHYAGAADPSVSMQCGVQEAADPANLACVHGLVFADGYLYYTRSDEVRRFPYNNGDRAAPTPSGELVAALGGKALSDVRWTHAMDRAKDGSIYVTRGRFDAACSVDTMAEGAVLSISIAPGTTYPVTPTTVADGFRDPLYIRCQPGCGDCYTNELSGDGWDSFGGKEKLALVEPGGHFGYPCCISKNVPGPNGTPDECSKLSDAVSVIPLHDTPFGMDFEEGAFPAPYTFGVFVALHGSFGGWRGTGISWLPTDPTTHRPTGAPTPFASGWGHGAAIEGRATDVAFAPDGRLFVADDTAGRIFWIAPRTLRAAQ